MNNFKTEFFFGFLSAVVAWITSFYEPILGFIVFIGFLVTADMYTGIKAARKRKELISSRGLSRSVEKITLYIIVITASQGMTLVFDLPFQVAWFAAFYVAITEFKSLLENTKAITGVDLWQEMKSRLTSFKPKE